MDTLDSSQRTFTSPVGFYFIVYFEGSISLVFTSLGQLRTNVFVQSCLVPVVFT